MPELILRNRIGNEFTVLYDNCDSEIVFGYRWRIGGRGYVVCDVPDATTGKIKKLMMHRVILGAPSGMEVDHINHNRIDNRRCNIRLCTRAENQRNKRVSRIDGRASRYKGVTFTPSVSRWRSTIYWDGRKINLGSFGTEKEAALAYNAGAKMYHGEFACLNSI